MKQNVREKIGFGNISNAPYDLIFPVSTFYANIYCIRYCTYDLSTVVSIVFRYTLFT